MALYFFECPCCGENHVLDLAVVFEPTEKVNPKDWEVFLRVANKVAPKIHESEKFKEWQKAMA